MKAAAHLKCAGDVIGKAILQKSEYIKKRTFSCTIGPYHNTEPRYIFNSDILKHFKIL